MEIRETQDGAPAELLICYQENTALLMINYQTEKWLKCENIQG